MSTLEIGIILNGVTGRMGLNQHLRRSIQAIRQDGGVTGSSGDVIMPRPLLVGRNPSKLEAIANEFGGLPWTTDLDRALEDPTYSIYFDAQTTDRRVDSVQRAIRAGNTSTARSRRLKRSLPPSTSTAPPKTPA